MANATVEFFERTLVEADLERKGITNYTIQRGNDCVWVSHGRCDCYYIIREGKIKDIIYD